MFTAIKRYPRAYFAACLLVNTPKQVRKTLRRSGKRAAKWLRGRNEDEDHVYLLEAPEPPTVYNTQLLFCGFKVGSRFRSKGDPGFSAQLIGVAFDADRGKFLGSKGGHFEMTPDDLRQYWELEPPPTA
jgi:hypothetical protein